jgi:sigma-E factor negative regulatory protein RseC
MGRVETEIGKVIDTEAGRARVEVSPSSLCADCEMAAGCIPASGGKRVIEVADPIGVSVGQNVQVELGSASLVLASFLAYIIPILCLLTGVLIGVYAGGSAISEMWLGIGALVGLLGGLLVSRVISQRLRAHGKLTPIITTIIATNNEGDEGK